MKALVLGLGLILLQGGVANAGVATTATGIPVDCEWKKEVYAFALQNVVHPSWGITHSERDYQITKRLAEASAVPLDLDVLFAAAFLHDLGGIGSFEKPGVDHAIRSVEIIEPLLKKWKFPMQKWPDVKDMILTHTYYGPASSKPQSQAFRDADILDFLGSMGVARILAVAEEGGKTDVTLKSSFDTLRKFEASMPAKLSLKASQLEAEPKLKQMERFFKEIDFDSLEGRAL